MKRFHCWIKFIYSILMITQFIFFSALNWTHFSRKRFLQLLYIADTIVIWLDFFFVATNKKKTTTSHWLLMQMHFFVSMFGCCIQNHICRKLKEKPEKRKTENDKSNKITVQHFHLLCANINQLFCFASLNPIEVQIFRFPN